MIKALLFLAASLLFTGADATSNARKRVMRGTGWRAPSHTFGDVQFGRNSRALEEILKAEEELMRFLPFSSMSLSMSMSMSMPVLSVSSDPSMLDAPLFSSNPRTVGEPPAEGQQPGEAAPDNEGGSEGRQDPKPSPVLSDALGDEAATEGTPTGSDGGAGNIGTIGEGTTDSSSGGTTSEDATEEGLSVKYAQSEEAIGGSGDGEKGIDVSSATSSHAFSLLAAPFTVTVTMGFATLWII